MVTAALSPVTLAVKVLCAMSQAINEFRFFINFTVIFS